ncbi:MAG: AAA family ATPase [Comamonas sp.]
MTTPTIYPAPSAAPCAELLHSAQLRRRIDPQSLGFASTAELLQEPFSWIGQERAQAAAEFGLALDQPDYHLFVLGDEGSGRTSLLRRAMQAEALRRPAAPDICFVHNFAVPERPLALRLPAGQGRILRRRMEALTDKLPRQLEAALSESHQRSGIEQIYHQARQLEDTAFAQLQDWARAQDLDIGRDNGQLVIRMNGPARENSEPNQPPGQDTPAQAAINSEADHSETDHASSDTAPTDEPLPAPDAAADAGTPPLEYQLRLELAQFRGQVRLWEQQRDEALQAFYRDAATPLWTAALARLGEGLTPQGEHAATLQRWQSQVQAEWLKQIDLWVPRSIAQEADEIFDGGGSDDDAEQDDERHRREAGLQALRALSQVNLVVDHHGESHAPVVIEDQPSLRNLFGTIDPPSHEDEQRSDFSCIRAGSVLRADGGFLLLHLRDLAGTGPDNEAAWQYLRRVLRTRQLRIEDVHASQGPSSSSALLPELLPLSFKLVLIGSEDSYYQLQEADPDMARRFRCKVEFSAQFKASTATYRATAALMAQRCAQYRLPHCDAGATARLLEESHREADDQQRQSGRLNTLEALLVESAHLAQLEGGHLVSAANVEAAVGARRLRHNAMEEALHDAIAEGEHVIAFSGRLVGQLNGMSQIDTGDHRFGLPVRISARTFAGQDGVLNIEREVAMSGPIHDKGVLILQSYLTSLFGHLAPLALNASVVFEQEYSGIEGDSASCAELLALLSSLSGLPLLQNIAVTGALNQHGEILPVGGLNEKIEGWFDLCASQGLHGAHGVLIPARNQRHLMLDQRVIAAVQAGRFHVYTAEHVSQAVALLMEQTDCQPCAHPSTVAGPAPLPALVMERAEARLRQFRLALQKAEAAPKRSQRQRGKRVADSLRGE